MIFSHQRNKKGFTLIELLVVITIIGMLSAVVLTSLGSARAKARDTRRKEDVHSIMNALSIYYDNHGAYPANNYNGACGQALNGADPVSVSLNSDGLIKTTPTVPSNSGTCGDYYYAGSNTGPFDLTSCLTYQCIAVLTKLENVDANCVAWNGATSWYATGSYCNGYYIQVLGR